MRGCCMKLRKARAAGLAFGLTAFIATTASAALSTGEQKRLNDSAAVVTALRGAENGISEDLWQKAQCVIVIPDMKKAAFIVGGEYGKGVMSCRTASGWSSPVFMELEKGSWGFQAGAQEIDLVLLVMNRDAATKMLDSKVSLGADASVAAGPVGRAASASTSGNLRAQVLSYSRSRGVFGGIDLSGGALKADKDSNKDAYGTTAPADVISGGATMPPAAAAFVNTLGSTARATTGKATPSPTDAPKKY
jgi:SH3 domain-containing YSC84-like protein 1